MKLLVADDHTLFRDALVQYIVREDPDAEVTLAKDWYEAMDFLEEDNKFDLVLLDLCMPGMSGLKGFQKMKDDHPEMRLALMSGVAEEEHVKEAIDMGAVGYFPKTLSGKALLNAIKLVLSGERFIPLDHQGSNIMPSYRAEEEDIVRNKHMAQTHVDMSAIKDDIDLTPRESDVLKYLVQGLSNKEIARELGLQVVTIKLHVRGICRKLNANNRTQAALKAHQMGLVSAESAEEALSS